MIRVNLLPTKRKKKPKAIPPFIVYMVLLTVVSVIVSGYLYLHLSSQFSALQKKKKDNEAQIADLKNKIKEVEDYEAQRKTLEQRKGVIVKLKKNQSLPVKILSEISKTVPDGVWLQSLTISGNSLKISGAGFTNEEIVNYVENLKKSQFFTDVNLEGTQKSVTGKVMTYLFNITCKIKAL